MGKSVILIEHPESTADIKALIQDQNTKAESNQVNLLKKYFNGVGGGARRANVEVRCGSVCATNTLTLDAAVATNTVVINGVTLTADTDFSVGADDDATAANLVTAINDSVAAKVAGYVTAELTTNELNEVTSITCVADVADSLDGTYFIIGDEAGSVAFWFDTDNSGTTIPGGASAADRAVEITTIVTGDDADTVAAAVATAVNADSKFSASAVGAVVTATTAVSSLVGAADAGDSGFTLSTTTEGADTVVTLTAVEPGLSGNMFTLAATGAITAGAAAFSGGTAGDSKSYDYSYSE